MGILFWALLKSIIFSCIGNSFYKWFQKTKIGIWFDVKLARTLNKIVGKEDVAREKANKTNSKQLDMFDGDRNIHHGSKSGK